MTFRQLRKFLRKIKCNPMEQDEINAYIEKLKGDRKASVGGPWQYIEMVSSRKKRLSTGQWIPQGSDLYEISEEGNMFLEQQRSLWMKIWIPIVISFISLIVSIVK